MNFKIRGTDGSEWVYDNATNHIDSLSGMPTNIDDCKKYYPFLGNQKIAERISRDARYVPYPQKSRLIKKLRIQLGINCNYKCAFCIQADEARKMSSPVVLTDGIDNFFKMLERANITVDPLAKIELWGGEPLVYWKSIEILLPRLREKYPQAVISMISNGTLINEKILDFLIKYRVDVTFSHDAQAYFLRGPDPLDDPRLRGLWVETFNRYKETSLNFGINTVISQYNADLYAVQAFFAEKIDPNVSFGFEGVVIAHSPNAVNFTKFPKQAREQLRDSIFRAIVLEPESGVGHALRKRASLLISRIVNEIPAMTIQGRCDVASPNSLSVDLFGNILTCHNVNPKDQSIGHLLNYDQVQLDKLDHWSVRDNCPNCYVLNACQGNCMRTTSELHKLGCDVEKMFHGFIFEAVWFLLTGTLIQSIENTSRDN